MNIKQLRELVVRPVLKDLGCWTQAAEELMLGTAAQESHCGEYIRQVGCNGSVGAFGVWQMELATARDIYDNYLKYKPQLKQYVDSLKGVNQSIGDALMYNIGYACAMARIHYLRQPGKIPDDLDGQSRYYKQYFNTPLGKATPDEYVDNYNRYVISKK